MSFWAIWFGSSKSKRRVRFIARWAARQDGNAKEIDAALIKIGVSVYKLGAGTIDRVLGYGGKNYLVEYKDGSNKLTPAQKDFVRDWRGQVAICRSLEDVLRVLGIEKS